MPSVSPDATWRGAALALVVALRVRLRAVVQPTRPPH
jgi:hypothetical protein